MQKYRTIALSDHRYAPFFLFAAMNPHTQGCIITDQADTLVYKRRHHPYIKQWPKYCRYGAINYINNHFCDSNVEGVSSIYIENRSYGENESIVFIRTLATIQNDITSLPVDMDLGDRIQKHVYILFKWDKGFKIMRNLEPFSRFPQNQYHVECLFFGYTLSYCTQDGIIDFR